MTGHRFTFSSCQIRDTLRRIKKKIEEKTAKYDVDDTWYPTKDELKRYSPDDDLT